MRAAQEGAVLAVADVPLTFGDVAALRDVLLSGQPGEVAGLGAKDMFHAVNVTCSNHEGDSLVTFRRWDGTRWKVISGWIAPDWAPLQPVIEQDALPYAKEKGITPNPCTEDRES